VASGIKHKGKPDLALLVSDLPATAAGTLTRNRIQGVTVQLCRERLASGGKATAVVVNSGNANACTGPRGMEDARRMGRAVATALGVDQNTVLVCSTGVIGVALPVEKIEAAVPGLVGALGGGAEGGAAAARAIMTTDTVPKEAAEELVVDDRTVRIGGMAKGAGMIEPDMATMLAFLTTDAAVEREALQEALSAAVNASFNRITVDGDQSCNDTVLLMANGAAGNRPLNRDHAAWSDFCSALNRVALDLARMIVKDGEGATKFVTVQVRGARCDGDAECAARRIANSLLVKTSWFGEDPNWGRVIDAVGHAYVEIEPDRIDILYDDLPAVRNGMAAPGVPLAELEAVLRRPAFTVTVDLHMGEGAATVYTCDCSVEYVKINSDYTS
jgi:glutamate N-acetyltransferase/amino-acid N-acetyltransferase